MYDNEKGPLEIPGKLKQVVNKLNDMGKMPRTERDNVILLMTKSQSNMMILLMTKSQSNIMVIISTALGTLAVLGIGLVAIKYFKLNSIVKGFGLVSLLPPPHL